MDAKRFDAITKAWSSVPPHGGWQANLGKSPPQHPLVAQTSPLPH